MKMTEKIVVAIITGGLGVAAAFAGNIVGKKTTQVEAQAVAQNQVVNVINQLGINASDPSDGLQILADDYDDLKTGNKSLKEENESLKEENTSLKEENTSLKEENEVQRNNINTLEVQIKKLEQSSEVSKEDKDPEQDKDTDLSSGSVKLKDLFLVDNKTYNIKKSLVDSYGNIYDIGHEFYPSANSYAVYGLLGKYTSFTAYITVGKDSSSGLDATIQIYKDDEIIDTISGISKQTEVFQIGPYDISQARKLTIKTSSDSFHSFDWIYIVNAFVE